MSSKKLVDWDFREAYLACLMLNGDPWTMDFARAEGREALHRDPLKAIASAIGGTAGWIDGGECSLWIAEAVAFIAPKGTLDGPRAGWTELLFLIDVSSALRDTAFDQRRLEPIAPHAEYVFCLCKSEDCERMEATRRDRGLKWSEENLARCAMSVVDAMDEALARDGVAPGAASVCAPEVAARLALAEGARAHILEFLLKRQPDIHFPPEGTRMGCVGFEKQDLEKEECDLSRAEWDWVRTAPSAKGRSGFPWGFWLAWCVPSLAGEWGAALGASLDDDALLAREVAGFAYDREDWSHKEQESSRGVVVLLEKMSIEAASAPCQRSKRKTL